MLFIPVIDNGIGMSRTSWAVSMMGACFNAFKAISVEVRHISNPYPHHAMNLASWHFMESDADEMVIIDTDIKFTADQLTRLMSHDEPFVSGLYTKKMPGMNFVAVPLDGDAAPYAGDGLREFKRVAKGFLRLHRNVFERMDSNTPMVEDPRDGGVMREYWKTLPGGHSEDFEFCDKWRMMGGRVMVDTGIVVEHEGTALYPILETCRRAKEAA